MAGREVERRVLYRGWTTFGVATISERDGNTVVRVFEDHGEASCVLPYDAERRVALLVRQLRVGPLLCGEAGEMDEAPAGGIEAGSGESPPAAARREVFEETGVRLGTLEPVGAPYPMPSISTERLHLYLAPYAMTDRVATGGGLAGEGEQIVVEEVALADLAARAATGAIDDLKTLVLVLSLQLRHPELFATSAAMVPPTV